MRAALDGLREQHPDRFVDVRGRGMIQGLVCAEPVAGGSASQPRRTARNLLVETSGREDQVVKLLPPLTIEEHTLSEGLGRLGEAVGVVVG